MSNEQCATCETRERDVRGREAELIHTSWLGQCATCARDVLREQVAEITKAIATLCRESDDYLGAGVLRDDDLESHINALVDVAKAIAADDEPTVRLAVRSAS